MKPEISHNEILTMRVYMTRHIGSNNRVSPEELARHMYGGPTANNIRKVRAMKRKAARLIGVEFDPKPGQGRLL